MKRVKFNLKNVAITAAIFAVTAAFAACEPADEPNPDAPAIAEFTFANQRGASAIDAKKRTVKAMAECGTNIASLSPEFKLSPEGTTAKVNGNLQTSGKTANNYADAVVYTLTTPEGETAEWTVTVTLPDDCPQVKKYITYNQPVKAYFIEYNGGAIDANKSTSAGKHGKVIEAYENRKYVYVGWSSYSISFDCEMTLPNGDWCFPKYGYLNGNTWYLDKLNGNPDYANASVVPQEYPLDRFAFLVSKRTLGGGFLYYNSGGLNDLADIALNPSEATMPNHTDVTQFYIRSEKVMEIMCDVFVISETTTQGTATATFWVDPATGLTLKLEAINYDGTRDEYLSYEVTELVIGKPDWDGKHLHPLPTDTVIEP